MRARIKKCEKVTDSRQELSYQPDYKIIRNISKKRYDRVRKKVNLFLKVLEDNNIDISTTKNFEFIPVKNK